MISVLLPTTGRPQYVERCVRGLIETTEGHEIELVVAVDKDPDTVGYLWNLVPPERFRIVIDNCTTHYRGNTAWNDALAEASGDPIVFAADDLDWRPGWLDAALHALDANPGFLIGFNDGHFGPELATHYLMPRSFIREVLGGRVAWEHYPHSFNDAETTERARRARRYRWCQEARVFHVHWMFGQRQADATDKRNLHRYGEAEALFEQRKAAGFPDDLPAVI